MQKNDSSSKDDYDFFGEWALAEPHDVSSNISWSLSRPRCGSCPPSWCAWYCVSSWSSKSKVEVAPHGAGGHRLSGNTVNLLSSAPHVMRTRIENNRLRVCV